MISRWTKYVKDIAPIKDNALVLNADEGVQNRSRQDPVIGAFPRKHGVNILGQSLTVTTIVPFFSGSLTNICIWSVICRATQLIPDGCTRPLNNCHINFLDSVSDPVDELLRVLGLPMTLI